MIETTSGSGRDASLAGAVAERWGHECRRDADGRWLYVNETYGARISRFAIRPDGDLGPRETYVQFGPEIFPDGLVFDATGGLWVTSVFSSEESNR